MQIYKKIFIAAKNSPFCLRYLTKNVNNIPSSLGLYSKADTRFIPAKFQLHGKVERRALPRTPMNANATTNNTDIIHFLVMIDKI